MNERENIQSCKRHVNTKPSLRDSLGDDQKRTNQKKGRDVVIFPPSRSLSPHICYSFLSLVPPPSLSPLLLSGEAQWDCREGWEEQTRWLILHTGRLNEPVFSPLDVPFKPRSETSEPCRWTGGNWRVFWLRVCVRPGVARQPREILRDKKQSGTQRAETKVPVGAHFSSIWIPKY